MVSVIEQIRARIAPAIEERGGKAYLVGGYVRDHVLGVESKDIDVEVHGLELDEVEEVLVGFGPVDHVGRSFGVLKLRGVEADFSLPRRDTKIAPGHRGFDVTFDPHMGFAEAARRRDFTINSMGMDAVTGEVVDPHGGADDLRTRVLRETDARYFAEDPLRGLRAAQLAARFELQPTDSVLELCRGLDLSELPGERLKLEFDKLLLRARRPSIGLAFLRETSLIRFFPELQAMIGTPQDSEWHPEGEVWTHVLNVVDQAAALEIDDAERRPVVMYGALCHDLGKPATTTEEDGRIKSPGHEEVGLDPARSFMRRLAASQALTDATLAMVAEHSRPLQFMKGGATDKAYRRLARKLEARGTTMEVLELVARADFRGRATPDAAGPFAAGDEFLRRAAALEVETSAPADVVLGRHLIARGMKPGPEFGEILERCRDIQDETGWDDPDRILAQALENEG